MSIDKQRDPMPVANELESYFYEAVFMRSLECVLPGNWSDARITELQSTLKTRKAIQFNLHLLSNYLCCIFFSGSKIDDISEEFVTRMRKIFSHYEPKSCDEWFEFANLSEPVSRVGYLRAYEKTFI
jgi:hypothetical protein